MSSQPRWFCVHCSAAEHNVASCLGLAFEKKCRAFFLDHVGELASMEGDERAEIALNLSEGLPPPQLVELLMDGLRVQQARLTAAARKAQDLLAVWQLAAYDTRSSQNQSFEMLKAKVRDAMLARRDCVGGAIQLYAGATRQEQEDEEDRYTVPFGTGALSGHTSPSPGW